MWDTSKGSRKHFIWCARLLGFRSVCSFFVDLKPNNLQSLPLVMADWIPLVIPINCVCVTSLQLTEWLSSWDDATWPMTLLFSSSDFVWEVCIDSYREKTSRFSPWSVPLPRSCKWLNHFLTYSFPTMDSPSGSILNKLASEIALFILPQLCPFFQ